MFFRSAVVAALVLSASAFSDTSPFIYFSTTELSTNTSPEQLQSAHEVLKSVKGLLSACLPQVYVLVLQPNVNALDVSSAKSVPYMRGWMRSSEVRGKFSVSEVTGTVDADDIEDFLTTKCAADVSSKGLEYLHQYDLTPSKPVILHVSFPSLPNSAAGRVETLANNDATFGNLRSLLESVPDLKYTVMYTTSATLDRVAHKPMSYDPEFQEPLHIALKRQTAISVRKNMTKSRDTRPLFEKYQYFTPGIFMGIFVSLILLSILLVGVKGLSSLQVSYAAFDKEMGPGAQRKTQ